MAEIKSNYEIDIINTARKYLGEPHSVSLLALAVIDECNKNLDINFYVYDEISVELYMNYVLTTLLRNEANKVLFRSCKVNGVFVTEFQKTANLTDQTNPPVSSDDFLLKSKVIMDMEIEENRALFKFYRLNERQPRTLHISIQEQELVEIKIE